MPFRLGHPGINLFNPEKILSCICFFLLVFPKGGFKIAGIPITWGYMLLGILSLAAAIRKKSIVSTSRLYVLAGLLPFQLVSFATLLKNDCLDIGMTLSFFISFFFLPFTFFFLLSESIENLDLNLFFSLLKKGVLFVATYGIFLFFFKSITGNFIEIPLLTVNLGDLGMLEEKHINRNGMFKLISTYNNGNLYGICLLMILPLYCLLEEKKWANMLVKASLVLTLSRTVWIGLLLYEMFFRFYISPKKTNFVKLIVSITSIFSAFFLLQIFLNLSPNFFLDANLGGRREQLTVFNDLLFFSDRPFSGISEIVYLGILSAFGVIGLLTFIFALSTPVFLQCILNKNSQIHKSIISGLTIYLIISFSDGAILFLPTMAFYWFLLSLLKRRNLEKSPQDWGELKHSFSNKAR